MIYYRLEERPGLKEKHMTKKIKLSEVDGTVAGRAALVLINLNAPDSRSGFMQSLFVEGEHDCEQPISDCWGLWEGTKNDWPDHTVAVIANPRAKYLKWQIDMAATIGPGDYSPGEYLEC